MLELSDLHASGIFLRSDALDRGYLDRDLIAARRDGVIVRVRHGAYVDATTWQQADDVGQHLLRADAVLLTHPGRVVLSHTTAAAPHGLRLFEPDLRHVHVTRLDEGSGGIAAAGVRYHKGVVGDSDLVVAGHRAAVTPLRAALETAALHDVEKGLVVLDSLVDLEHATVDDVRRAHADMQRWPMTGKLQITVRLVREGAKSAGESRSRFACWRHGLPEPQLQYEIRDSKGRLVAVVDLAWPEYGVLGEFDGFIKYGRLLKPGQDPGEVVFKEKEREDLIREITNWVVVRIIWKQLYDSATVAARIRAKLDRAA